MKSYDKKKAEKEPHQPKLRGKGQANRLGKQHEEAGGPLGIFGEEAQKHDLSIREVSELVFEKLKVAYPNLEFRHRSTLSKKEINEKLVSLHPKLGNVLFVDNSAVRPDGGIIEVKDVHGNWRIVLVGESKHQGNDVEKIEAGIKQGKNKDQDLMAAGNAIERVHKNIAEFKNLMLDETHFPYVVFLQGSNFSTNTFFVETPKGRKVKIAHNSGALNRIDRVTASSFGMEINKNHCRNLFVKSGNHTQMLQVASLYFQCPSWTFKDMFEVMWEIILTSLEVLSDSLPSS